MNYTCFSAKKCCKKKYIKILAWLFVISWACIIFWFSSQPADDSANMSSETIKVLYDICSGLVGERQNPEEMIEVLTLPVRKFAHVSEYIIFYLSLLFAFHTCALQKRRCIFSAIAIAFCYACSDEFHQLFVPGRSARFTDVLIDMLGVSVISVILLLRERKETK